MGFVIPPESALTSGAAPYNVFHIIFGSFGILLLFSNNQSYIREFNIAFELIDLYQAFASFLHLFPEQLFQWTRVDDVLHVVIGIMLVAVGLIADRKPDQ
ncbi:MAG: hypothetical protein WKF92_10375 [Pyrinomonadaceae bacterium]